MRTRYLLLILLLPAAPLSASEPGHWGLESGKRDNRWADYTELKPDFPAAWSVEKLAGVDDDEVLLRTAGGAMLRWVETRRMRHLYASELGIERAAELQVSVYITRGDTPNAGAGRREGVNTVLINFAMLDMVGNNRDQWAALLGHELAHLKLDHGGKRFKRSIPLAVLKTVAGATIADPLSRTASQFLIDGVGSTFSRDEESQADYMGVIWAVEAGNDPYGAVSLHELMSARSAGHPVPFLSSHPSSRKRIEELTALADRLSK